MKNKFLLIALLLAICQFQSGILCAQSLIPVDSSGVWYTDKQDIRCLICLVNEPKKDSIILEQYNFIQFQDSTILELNDLNQKQKAQSKRKKTIFSTLFGVGGVFIGWFSSSLIK